MGKRLAGALLASGIFLSGWDGFSVGEEESWWSRLFTRQEITENLPVEIPDLWSGEWGVFGRQLESKLKSFSLEDVARLKPQVAEAVNILRSVPGGSPYADWLGQRLDYFEMASYMLQSQKAKTGQTNPTQQTPVKVASVPVTSSQKSEKKADVDGQRKKVAQGAKVAKVVYPSIEKWKQSLKNRPKPAEANQLIPTIKGVFREEGIPAELVWLAEVESSLNPEARSPVGAAGLFQFMPATAQRFGLVLEPKDERLEPAKSARAAARYLRFLHGKFTSWPLAFAAYNAGEGRVRRLLQEKNASSFEDIAEYLPLETRMYVPKVMAVVSLREGKDPNRLPGPSKIAAPRAYASPGDGEVKVAMVGGE